MPNHFREPQASGNTEKVNRRTHSRKCVWWCGVGGYPSSGFLVLWSFERKTPLITCQLAKVVFLGVYRWYWDKHHQGKSTLENRLLEPLKMVLLEYSLPNLVPGNSLRLFTLINANLISAFDERNFSSPKPHSPFVRWWRWPRHCLWSDLWKGDTSWGDLITVIVLFGYQPGLSDGTVRDTHSLSATQKCLQGKTQDAIGVPWVDSHLQRVPHIPLTPRNWNGIRCVPSLQYSMRRA